MRVYRLARARYAALDGEGARLHGGRWTAPGVRAIYAARHRSLALLETLVHLQLDPDFLPPDYLMLEIDIPDRVRLSAARVPRITADYDFQSEGMRWVRDGSTAVLVVPSVVVPQESNVIINPAHTDFRRIQIVGKLPFVIDRRLLAPTQRTRHAHLH